MTAASILDRLTKDRALPDGCDRWALKATDFAGRTRGGFQWPTEGWVECAAPDPSNLGACPAREGDGLCVGLTYKGIAQGSHRALALLLVAYAQGDVLGEDVHKVRLRRVRVVERLDGERVLRDFGAGADLTRANLTGANLTGANLTGADLTDADLTRAYLTDADLTDANLTRANLTDAYLTDAYLTRANLTRAYLTRAYLTGANLTDANLTRANLTDANLTDAYLTGANLTDARHNRWTRWPDGYTPPEATA